ncbi:hypothetical protein GINT2_002203 [Glugoides intestinalis]
MDSYSNAKESYNNTIDIKGALTGFLPGDRTLLEELSIDLLAIKEESLLPFKILQKHYEEVKTSSDLTGPIILLLTFTFSLVFQGKIHFGYIYLISLTSSFLIYILINLLSVRKTSYLTCCSTIGYSMTPVVAFSFANIVLSRISTTFSVIIGVCMCLWSAYTAALVFSIQLQFAEKTLVILYPLFLAYMCFMMMTLF